MKFIWLKRRRAKKCGEAHEHKHKHELKHQQLEMYVDFGKYLHCNRYLYSKQMHSSDTSCKEDNYACSQIHSFSWRLVYSNGAWEELIQRKNKKNNFFHICLKIIYGRKSNNACEMYTRWANVDRTKRRKNKEERTL